MSPQVTRIMFTAMAIRTILPVLKKKMLKGVTTIAVSSSAAPRRCVRHRMQLISVIDM